MEPAILRKSQCLTQLLGQVVADTAPALAEVADYAQYMVLNSYYAVFVQVREHTLSLLGCVKVGW